MDLPVGESPNGLGEGRVGVEEQGLRPCQQTPNFVQIGMCNTPETLFVGLADGRFAALDQGEDTSMSPFFLSLYSMLVVTRTALFPSAVWVRQPGMVGSDTGILLYNINSTNYWYFGKDSVLLV